MTFSIRFWWATTALLLATHLDCSSKRAKLKSDDVDLDIINDDGKDKTFQERVFSLFTIVTFKNSACRSSSGTTGSGVNRNGTCYTITECSDKGGTISGNCAAGFGVCCLFLVSAGSSTISENCTYLQNPSFPSVYTSTTALTYTVSKCASNVCTLRLDFETFTLVGPANTVETTGVCTDSFQVTGGSGLTTPVICGKNTGYHIYYDIGATSGNTATISFTFSATSSTVRTWEIKVTQLACSNAARPYDTGCLQYFTGATGRIETFNFQETTTGSIAHLASQSADAGNCCISYSPCTDANSWSIDLTANSNIDTLCTEDYLGINGAMDTCDCSTNNVLHSKLCGIIFNTVGGSTIASLQACDCTAPFTVDVRTDATNDNGIDANAPAPSRGICLNYQQQACACG